MVNDTPTGPVGGSKPGTPTISRVRYDAAVLTVSWQADANPATTFVVYVLAEGVPVARAEAGTVMHAWLPVELGPAVEHAVVVQAMVGASEGPTSEPVRILLDEPTVSSATTDPVTGDQVVTWDGRDGASYVVRLRVDGATAGLDRAVVGPSVTLAPPPQPPGCSATVAVAEVVEDAGATSIGPFGPAFALPTARPDLLAVVRDDGAVAASWTAVPGATGYLLSVLQGDAARPVAQADVAGPATETTVAATLDPPGPYRAVAQAVFTTGSGPASEPVPVLLAAPGVTATTGADHAVTVTVTAPDGPAPWAYELVLGEGGDPVERRVVPATGADLRLPVGWRVDPSATHDVTVRAMAGRSTGPAASAPAVLAAPEVASITCGDRLTVRADRGTLPADGLALDAVVLVDGEPGPVQRMEGGAATFDVPAGRPVAVAVRGVVGAGTGPWSAPVPAVVDAPTVAAARYAAGRLEVAWDGPADGTFLVAATSGVVTVASTTTTGATAGLALDAGDGQAAFDVAVTRLDGVATGPSAVVPLVTAGCRVTAATVGADRELEVGWEPPAAPADLTAVQAVLTWGTSWAALAPVPPGTQPVRAPVPADVPSGALVAVRAVAGVATGPTGEAAPVVTAAPTGLAVDYDGADLGVTWHPMADPAVDRYTVTVGSAPAVFTAPPATLPFAGGERVAVTVAGMAGVTTGATCTPVPVIVEAPSLTRVVHDGTAVELGWTPVADEAVTGYVASAPGAVAAVAAGTTAVGLALPAGPASVTVRATGAGTLGRPSEAVAVVTTAPAVTAAFDPVTGDVAVDWGPVDGATGYHAAVLDGARVVVEADVPAAPWTVPAGTCPAGGDYRAVVRATASTASCEVAGPPSTPAPVVATAPASVATTYDGATVRASWEPVRSPAVTGYRVLARSGDRTAVLGVTTSSGGSWPLTATAADATALVVQALAGGSVGAASAPAPLFTAALHLAAAGSGTAPYVVPQTGPPLTAADVHLYLPDLFPQPPDPADLPTRLAPLLVTLEPASGQGFSYRLTVPADSPLWRFDGSAVRTDLTAAWVDFLKVLQGEKLRATAAGVLAVQDAAARSLPQTFLETLFFSYGVRFDRGCVDLRPGVVLRVEYESYQTFGSQVSESAYLSGYVTTAVAEYEVASYRGGATPLTGLDAFLGNLAAARGTSVTPPAPPDPNRAYGSGGVVDAFFTQFQQPFCRLVYAPTFLPTNTVGSAYPQMNPVLVAGSTVADVEVATDNVRAGRAPGRNVASLYFRGRTALTAMVRVDVGGERRLVPLGTTVGNALAGDGRRPPGVGLALPGLRMTRGRGGAVLDAAAVAAGYDVRSSWDVRLDWSPGNGAWLDLPLLHGDRLTWDHDPG